MKKFVSIVLLLTYMSPGCIYMISDETKTLAQTVHEYAAIQETQIKSMLSGGEVTQEVANEVLENATNLTATTSNLSDILGKPEKQESAP
jgi:phenylacetate-coenzyme A ligase PaaK-like adenylate-forming protein